MAPIRRKRRRWPIVLLLLLVLAGGGTFACHRLGVSLPQLPQVPFVSDLLSRLGIGEQTIAITVDGQEVRVPADATVQAVYDQVKPEVTAGNLLSVTGEVLQEGQGEAYAATLNGSELPYADAPGTPVSEGADLSFADGADVNEDYTSETRTTTQPKLVRQVQQGTAEPGYMVQEGVLQYVYQWGKEGTAEVRTGTVSGQTVEVAATEGQDCIIMCQDVHPDNDEKLVALTFDDGPTYYTEQYMDILDRYGIVATFNLIGEQVEDCADVVKANCASSNQITSHTWNHPDLPTLSQEDLRAQLDDTFDVIKRVGECDTSTIRAPYGDISIDVWLKSGGSMSLSVFWTHDSLDWETPGVDAIVANCTGNMHPGSVILMHDGGGNRDQDLEALPRIIEAWQEAGYRFVTVEELMASDSSIPEECCANYRPMPEDAVWPTELAESSDATVVE